MAQKVSSQAPLPLNSSGVIQSCENKDVHLLPNACARYFSQFWSNVLNAVVFLSEGNSELYRNSSPDNVPWLPRMVDYELGNLQNSPRRSNTHTKYGGYGISEET
jgi:hypothetical protein